MPVWEKINVYTTFAMSCCNGQEMSQKKLCENVENYKKKNNNVTFQSNKNCTCEMITGCIGHSTILCNPFLCSCHTQYIYWPCLYPFSQTVISPLLLFIVVNNHWVRSRSFQELALLYAKGLCDWWYRV